MGATERPLKVAHVLRRFTFDEWGGTETVVWHTVLQQRARGVDAEILCTAALSSPGGETRDGVTIRRFPYFYPYFPLGSEARLALDKKGGNPFSPELFRTLRGGGFDLVHIHCGGRMAVMCALLAHELNIPSVVSLHGGFAAVPPEELRKMMAVTRGKFHYGGVIDRLAGFRRNVIEEADAAICISREEESLLKQQHPHRRIVYLPNGVDCEKFAAKPDVSPRKEWHIPDDRHLVLCISRIDYQKNQLILLELAAKDPLCHLLLIGPVTSSWYRDEIVKQAGELGVSGRLTIIPGLAPDDPRLRAILHEAELFVLPSLHEPFGIAALEAWAAGVPVIASAVGGLRDFIVHERNGLLFAPGDAAALVENYEHLIRDAGLRRRLAENARQDVAAYSWSAITDRLLDLYKELENGRR